MNERSAQSVEQALVMPEEQLALQEQPIDYGEQQSVTTHSFLDRFRSRRVANILSIFAMAGGGSGIAAPVASGDVSPSGHQYDPEALALQCVEDNNHNYTYNDYYFTKHIKGQHTLSIPAYIKPMVSPIGDVPCPAPTKQAAKARIVIQNVSLVKHGNKETFKIKDVPASSWVPAVESSTGGQYVDAQGNTVTLTQAFSIVKGHEYTCQPESIDKAIKGAYRAARRAAMHGKRFHFPASLTTDGKRQIFLQVSEQAHSLDKSKSSTSTINLTGATKDAC